MITPIYHQVRPYPKAYFQCFTYFQARAIDYKATIWKSHRGLRYETNSSELEKELRFNSTNPWQAEKTVLTALEQLGFRPVPHFYNIASKYDLFEIAKLGVGKEWFSRLTNLKPDRCFDITGRKKDGTVVFDTVFVEDEEKAIRWFSYYHKADVILVREL